MAPTEQQLANLAKGHKFSKGDPARNNGEHQQSLDRFIALASADPEGARRLLESLTRKKFTPHPGQQPVMDCTQRFMTMCAGRRFGKTKIAAAIALKTARRENKMVWWVAPTYKVVKRGYAEVIRQLPEGVLTRPAPPETSFDAGRSVVLRFKTGARMEFYSAERPEGMLGEGVDFAILDEAAIMQEHIWQQIVRPTLADRQGKALFISTPRGRNWFYKMYQFGQDPLRADYASWRFPSMANPYIPADEWVEMEETLPRAVYEQEILADFISNAASVFRVPDDGIVEIQKPEGHVVIGVDLAKHNDFSVFQAVNSGNRMPCGHERFNAVSWPEQRQRLHRFIEKIEKTSSGITVMLDSTGVGDVVYDDLSLEGLDAIPVKFTNQWKQMAVMLLAADIERGNAFVHQDQMREFESYSYEITDAGRWKYEAASGHDDEVSAMLLAHWGVVNEGVPDIKMLTAGPQVGADDDFWDTDDDSYDVEGTAQELELPAPPSGHDLIQRGWW